MKRWDGCSVGGWCRVWFGYDVSRVVYYIALKALYSVCIYIYIYEDKNKLNVCWPYLYRWSMSGMDKMDGSCHGHMDGLLCTESFLSYHLQCDG
uniref:Uncharacterized protein n=1 Tax=Oryza brachyantha TaxID=4533 RepID=J3M6L0_ORYBR